VLDSVEKHSLRHEPPLTHEILACVDMWTVRIDQMQHRSKLTQARRELGDLTPRLQRIALSDHEPVGDLLKKISESFVVSAVRIVVFADE
jgi:hypothetical protein